MIELLLLISAIVIHFMTANANDFSGLAILFPIFGMFVVGLVGLIYTLLFSQKNLLPNDRSTRRKTGGKRVLLIAAFGLPILYMTGFAGSGLYTYLVIAILALLALREFLPNKLKIIADTGMIAAAIGLIIYAQSLNDQNILTFTVLIAGGFVISVVFSFFRSHKG